MGDLRRIRAALESVAGGGIEDRGGLLALEGLEGSGWKDSGQTQVACKFLRDFPRHTRECALAGVGDLDAESRASDFGRGRGHLGSQAAGKDTSGGHCM